ncbi:TolC family protein [soil metagenome]
MCAALAAGADPSAALSQSDYLAAPGNATALPEIRRVTLDEALRLFERHSPDLRIAREEAAAARARALSAGAFANPGLGVMREQLSDGERDYDETVLSISQTLEIAGQRGLRRDAARRAADAAQARLSAEQLRLGFEVRRAFIQAAAAESRLAAFEQATEVVRQVERSGRARFTEGDISDFARQRLQIERARYEDQLARARLDLTQAGRDLALLVSPDTFLADGLLLPLHPLDSLAVPIPELPPRSVQVSAAERPDVRAAGEEVEAARGRVALAERDRIPDITVGGGYKDQADGFRGGVIELSVPLPLMDRNAGRIAEAQADLAMAEARGALVLRRAEADIRRAWETYQSLVQRIEEIDRDLLAGTTGLLDTARFAYAEGEMTLVELLDAAEAYRASREMAIDLLALHAIAIYDLERATGGAATDPTTPRNEEQL